MKTLVKHVERYSVIRLSDGRLAVWEKKTHIAITDWGKTGTRLYGDDEVEVVKNPCHLAADYLAVNSAMKCTFNTTTNQLSAFTKVGQFHSEQHISDLYDTWMGNDEYDINVFCENEDAETPTFKATLYKCKPVKDGGGIIDNPIETCLVELL